MGKRRYDLNIEAAILTAAMDENQIIEMSRQLRELSEMSIPEREIWGLQDPEDWFVANASTDAIIEARMELLKMCN